MQLGGEWNMLKQLEQFTLLKYGHTRESLVDVVRAKFLRKMVDGIQCTSKPKVHPDRLPSCHYALKPHVQHVNHSVALYKGLTKPSWKSRNPTINGKGG